MILNHRAIAKLAGIIITMLGILMLPSWIVSLIYKEFDAVNAFTAVIIPLILLGSFISFKIKVDSDHLKVRDGFAIVFLCWMLASFFGSLPFIISGYIPNFFDAFFETASGFTTTGSTILTDIEKLPKGLLFWRSFTHWLGGMGILVFAIALLPALGIGGQKIIKAETTGPIFGKVTSRISDSSKILYLIYIGLSVIEVMLLMLGEMSLYDALIHTFGSIGTGGFSNYNDSIAHFDSVYIDVVLSVFMLLAGTNFTLFYLVPRGHWRDFFKDSELRFYFLIVVSAILFITFDLWIREIYTFGGSIRYSLFQSISILTTTGFMTADFDLWPSFSKMILFILMFIGGCSSSTSGGMKVIRILILLKMVKRGFALRLHPRAVVPVKLGGKVISANTVSAVTSFSIAYFGLFFLGMILLSLDNFDLLTTVSAVAACLGNIGPGFHLVGPILNYSIFSDFAKLLLTILMLVGRLELFTIILLFTRQFWNPDK
jgi:trk system potassium uptake protein TrkH